MKICFFNSCKAWGGGEKWHFEYSAALSEKGEEILLFADERGELYRKAKAEKRVKIEGIRIGNFSFLNIFKIIRLSYKMKNMKIESIIVNLPADLKSAGIAAKLAGIKKIIYRRGSAIPIKNSFLNRFLFKNIITGIIANSEETKKTINENNLKLFEKDKIKVIYNGIDIEKYDKIVYKEKKYREKDKIVIGNAGRLVEQKGQSYLIKIAEILKKREVEFKIVIAGNGPLEEKLKKEAMDRGVSECIEFLGFVENIKEFMESIDIFVLTSLWEGFGYVIVEAMLAKKPVIAFNISSNPEIIVENKSGFLTEANNGEFVAEKIIELINDEEKREEMGTVGRKVAEEKFSMTVSIEKVYNFLKR